MTAIKDAMSQIIQTNMSVKETVMNFEINQFIEMYANLPVQNETLDFQKNMTTSVKPIERIDSSLAEYFLLLSATSVVVERLFCCQRYFYQ